MRQDTRDVFVATVVAVACGFVVVHCSGCGASPVEIQADAIEIAVVAIETAGDEAETVMTRELAACTDAACTVDVEHRWAPVAVAHAAVLAALEAWASALDLMRVVGSDHALAVRAIARAVSALGARWNDLAAALRPLGTTLPELPPLVLAAGALLGGG